MKDVQRRVFFGKIFGAIAGVGAGASLIAMKSTWDPLPSVRTAGFTTVDISPLEEGVLKTVMWRGKPVFLLKHSDDGKVDEKRDVVVDGNRYTIVIGLCTHLGCIPEWKVKTSLFTCACHGGIFDVHGYNTFGPPPRPLDIPPFKIDGYRLVLGEEGEEYKKLMAMA